MLVTLTSEERFTLLAVDEEVHLDDLAEDVQKGLTASPKQLSSRFFYDEMGSQLFEDICELPEYYLTRAETEILKVYADEIAETLPESTVIVELGSGSSTKTRILIEAFINRNGRLRYDPIDISRTILEKSSKSLLDDYADLEIQAIAAGYSDGLHELNKESHRPELITWLGSSIGNYHRSEADNFLKDIRENMLPTDRLLVGIDLKKEQSVLERAYDDAQGITAQFNLNILNRINRELGGNFDLDSFEHRAIFNDAMSRVEMHLVSRDKQDVAIKQLDLHVSFAENETIHTENSYKYTFDDIEALAESADLAIEKQWLDSKKRFSLNLFLPLT